MEQIEQQASKPVSHGQTKLVGILIAGIVLLFVALIGVTGYFTSQKNSEKIAVSQQQPVPTQAMAQQNQTRMEQRRMEREESNSVLSFDPLVGWNIKNYAEDQVIHLTSPEYEKENFNLDDSYQMIPREGVLITMKVHDRIDMHFNLQELTEWMKTQGKWDKTMQTELGGIPTIHMFGIYKYPGFEDYSLSVRDDWYMSDEVNNTHFFDVRVTYAGTPTEATALKTKYQSQIDQLLKSIKFEVYQLGRF